jgi:hypothetical protein
VEWWWAVGSVGSEVGGDGGAHRAERAQVVAGRKRAALRPIAHQLERLSPRQRAVLATRDGKTAARVSRVDELEHPAVCLGHVVVSSDEGHGDARRVHCGVVRLSGAAYAVALHSRLEAGARDAVGAIGVTAIRPPVLIVQLELSHRSPVRVLDWHFMELGVLVLDGEVERHSDAVAGLAAAGLREDVAAGWHDARHRLLMKRDLVHDARRVNKVHELRERRGDHRGEDVHGEAGAEHKEECRKPERALRVFLRAADSLRSRGRCFGKITHAAAAHTTHTSAAFPNLTQTNKGVEAQTRARR